MIRIRLLGSHFALAQRRLFDVGYMRYICNPLVHFVYFNKRIRTSILLSISAYSDCGPNVSSNPSNISKAASSGCIFGLWNR